MQKVLVIALLFVLSLAISGCAKKTDAKEVTEAEEAVIEEAGRPERPVTEVIDSGVIEDSDEITVTVLGIVTRDDDFEVKFKIRNKLNRAIKVRSAYIAADTMVLRNDFIEKIEANEEVICSYFLTAKDMAEAFLSAKDVKEIEIELHAEENGKILFEGVYRVLKEGSAKDEDDISATIAFHDPTLDLPVPLQNRFWTKLGNNLHATYVKQTDDSIKLLVYNLSGEDFYLRRVGEGIRTADREMDLLSVEYFGTGLIPPNKVGVVLVRIDTSELDLEDDIRVYFPFTLVKASTGEVFGKTLFVNYN